MAGNDGFCVGGKTPRNSCRQYPAAPQRFLARSTEDPSKASSVRRMFLHPCPSQEVGRKHACQADLQLAAGNYGNKKKLTSTQNNTDQQVKDQPGKLVVKLKFLRFLFGYPATGGQSADEFHIDLNRTPKPY